MTVTRHRIVLEALPSNGSSPPLEEGYYGSNGWDINGFLYGRVPRDRAFQFDRSNAIRTIMEARRYGYPCHAEPPIVQKF